MTKEQYLESLDECISEEELKNVLDLATCDSDIEVEEMGEICEKFIKIRL